ncbi:MAG TPA: squalene/phytoene synthase family protein, partial [Vicinamibacterales bacterium]|nr:squalene/phytoene synthase family protein [Vicinamibacterales bacterium]
AENDLQDCVRKGTVTDKVVPLLRFECDRAREYYRRAAAQRPRVDTRSLVAAEIMGAIYYGILERIEGAGYEVFSRRIRVPRPQRALIALRIWIMNALGMQNAKFRMRTRK